MCVWNRERLRRRHTGGRRAVRCGSLLRLRIPLQRLQMPRESRLLRGRQDRSRRAVRSKRQSDRMQERRLLSDVPVRLAADSRLRRDLREHARSTEYRRQLHEPGRMRRSGPEHLQRELFPFMQLRPTLQGQQPRRFSDLLLRRGRAGLSLLELLLPGDGCNQSCPSEQTCQQDAPTWYQITNT